MSLDKRLAALRSLFAQLGPLVDQATRDTAKAASSVRLPDPFVIAAMLGRIRDPIRVARARGDLINIWTVAGVRRHELRNAATLAWLLNPRGSHGRGIQIVKGFIEKVAPQWRVGEEELLDINVVTEEHPLEIKEDRIDISIEGKNFILFVEVKIDAIETNEQLSRYVRSAKAKAVALRKNLYAVVYLAPKPLSEERGGEIISITWGEVAEIIHRCLDRHASATPTFGELVVGQFAAHIRKF